MLVASHISTQRKQNQNDNMACMAMAIKQAGRQAFSYLFANGCSAACIRAKTLTGVFCLLPVGQNSSFLQPPHKKRKT